MSAEDTKELMRKLLGVNTPKAISEGKKAKKSAGVTADYEIQFAGYRAQPFRLGDNPFEGLTDAEADTLVHNTLMGDEDSRGWISSTSPKGEDFQIRVNPMSEGKKANPKNEADDTFGYSNWPTGRFMLIVNNDQDLQEELHSVIRESETASDAMHAIKDMWEDRFDTAMRTTQDVGGLFGELFRPSVGMINWHEVVQDSWDEIHAQ